MSEKTLDKLRMESDAAEHEYYAADDEIMLYKRKLSEAMAKKQAAIELMASARKAYVWARMKSN